MRLSTDPADSGFAEAFCAGIDPRFVEVSLDGVVVGLAITADDQAGYVLRYAIGSGGELNLGADGEPLREEVRGRVGFRLLHCWDGIWPHSGCQEPDHGMHPLRRGAEVSS